MLSWKLQSCQQKLEARHSHDSMQLAIRARVASNVAAWATLKNKGSTTVLPAKMAPMCCSMLISGTEVRQLASGFCCSALDAEVLTRHTAVRQMTRSKLAKPAKLRNAQPLPLTASPCELTCPCLRTWCAATASSQSFEATAWVFRPQPQTPKSENRNT